MNFEVIKSGENQVNYYNIYLELIYGSAKSVGRKEATISYVKKR